jgi:hypothetical protein
VVLQLLNVRRLGGGPNQEKKQKKIKILIFLRLGLPPNDEQKEIKVPHTQRLR